MWGGAQRQARATVRVVGAGQELHPVDAGSLRARGVAGRRDVVLRLAGDARTLRSRCKDRDRSPFPRAGSLGRPPGAAAHPGSQRARGSREDGRRARRKPAEDSEQTPPRRRVRDETHEDPTFRTLTRVPCNCEMPARASVSPTETRSITFAPQPEAKRPSAACPPPCAMRT